MKKSDKIIKRRSVLKGLGAVSLLGLTGIGTYVSGLDKIFKIPKKEKKGANNQEESLRLGIIGYGIRGELLVRSSGFASPEWLKEAKMSAKKNEKDTRYKDFIAQPSLNIKYKGVCDIFDVRAEAALKTLGSGVKRYTHYQDLLNSDDIDAVIIATPDHWHAKMTMDAIKAGKHVYVEKCLTRTLDETYNVYETVKSSGLVFQLGHQLRHTQSYHAAKDAIDKGILGKISLIQTNSNRNSPNGAWVYNIHPQASPETIDWQQFTMPDNKVPFSTDRFFRWRKYWDYSTGLCGDLMTHDFDAINQIMGMGIPEEVVASGGNYYWKDGREVPDVLQVSMEYPSKGFTYHYSATQSSERYRPNLIMGDDATMEIGARMNIYPDPNSKRYRDKLQKGLMNPEIPFYSSEQALEGVDAVSSATTKYFENKGMLYTYRNGKRLDPTYLHIEEWLKVIRHGGTTSCNIDQAFEEAITAHMAVKSYRENRKVKWNKETNKVI